MKPNIIYSKELSDIVDVSKRSALAKSEICIFELGSLDQLIGMKTAEDIRREFHEHDIVVRQITNHLKLKAWTGQNELVRDNMRIRQVDPAVFMIQNEILIFDDTVAMYRVQPDVSYVEIQDAAYADMMRTLFDNIWRIARVMVLGVGGSASTKQYLPLSLKYKQLPAVIYPAKDDGDITLAFDRSQAGSIERYVQRVIDAHYADLKTADMLICYVWNEQATPMVDIWQVARNHISDDSGFLYDSTTFRELVACTDVGVSSGNSLIVYTAEELLLRRLVLDRKLSFELAADRRQYMPDFPTGFLPAESFYLPAGS